MKKNSDDLVVIMCPPHPEYKEPPSNHSVSELRDCGHCKSKMWLSQKKKGLLLFSALLHKDIFVGCYTCAKKFLIENSDKATEFKEVRL